MNGGYILVDWNEHPINPPQPERFPGIYSRALNVLEAKKPVFICNAMFGESAGQTVNPIPMSPVPVAMKKLSNGTITASAQDFVISITNDDRISYQQS